jgi:hypothetical protein
MATTFAALVTAILNEINVSGDSAMQTRVEGWVNDRHHEICSARQWLWLEVTSDSTNIKSSNHPFDITALKVSTTTTAARAIVDVLDTDYSPYLILQPTTVNAVRKSMQDYSNYTDTSEYWYMNTDTTIGLFPKPTTAGRNYTIRYIKASKTYSTGATDALFIPDRWIEVLKDAVLSKAWRWLDNNKWTQCESMYQAGLERMRRQDSEAAPIISSRQSFMRSRLPKLVDNS